MPTCSTLKCGRYTGGVTKGEQHIPAGSIMRHRHRESYAAIVLSGGYIEAGDSGCWHVEPGDVVVHQPFDAHCNTVPQCGAVVLNLPLGMRTDLPAAFRVDNADGLIEAIRSDPLAAASFLAPVEAKNPIIRDWPDSLADALRKHPRLRVSNWAMKAGLAPATVSRGFHAAYGVTAARYRADAQARVAWLKIITVRTPLIQIALECGFADQSHLTRAVTRLTGCPPIWWRTVKSVQDSCSALA